MARIPLPDQLVLQRLNTLGRWLPGAKKLDTKAIHQARVATRRLREALPVLTSGKTRRRLDKAARRLTRALGPVRELDVALLTLDELETAGDVPKSAVVRLRALIAPERRRLQTELKERLERPHLGKLRRRAADGAQAASTRAQREAIRDRRWLMKADERCARRAVRLREAIESAAGIYLPDRLHAVRIALKKFRYATELQLELTGVRTRPVAGGSRPSRGAAGRLRTLSQTQDLLGRMHDFEVLIARTRALQGSSAVPNLRMSADFDRLVRRLENECRLLHGRYMTARASVLEICDRAEALARRRRDARPAA